MSEAILEMQNVEKRFGGVRAIDQFSLKVEPGMIYGLIGPNGAGKTTLLSIMSAQNPASEGTVTWNGENVWENRKALDHICFPESCPSISMEAA
mgnify:CR=1 FL=1